MVIHEKFGYHSPSITHSSLSTLTSPQRKAAKWLEEAVTRQQSGDLQRAVEAYHRYLREHPRHAEVLHTLGGLYYQLQDLKSAGLYLEQAHRAAPGNPDFLNDLGAFCLMTGDFASAITYLTALLAITPENALAHYNLGLALHHAGRLGEAIDSFARAIHLQPDQAPSHYNLGVTYSDLGHYEDAIKAFRNVTRIEPGMALAYFQLGEALAHLRSDKAALESYRKARSLDPDNPEIISALALSLYQSGQAAEALSLLQDAVKSRPQSVLLLTTLAKLFTSTGQLQDAEEIYKKILAQEQYSASACYGLAHLRRFSNADTPIREKMEQILADDRLAEMQRRNVNFALGKIYDDCGEYDKAFQYYRAGNAIEHTRLNYDRKAQDKLVADTMEVFTGDFFSRCADFGCTGKLPIFIVGMPRSGTTLIEQILASHPEVHGAGELTFFYTLSMQPEALFGIKSVWPYWCRELDRNNSSLIVQAYLELLRRHSATARYVTDKMPGNFLYLGLIRALFPSAPVIHCRRDPLDVCLSIYFQLFQRRHSYAYDLMDIGHYYLQYARLMAHWRKVLPGPFLEINYAELVKDPESHSRKMIDFCGLPWDASCLDFHKLERNIRTASDWQVRQPVYDRSLARWKHYEKYLGPLQELFAVAQDEL